MASSRSWPVRQEPFRSITGGTGQLAAAVTCWSMGTPAGVVEWQQTTSALSASKSSAVSRACVPVQLYEHQATLSRPISAKAPLVSAMVVMKQ